MQKIYSLLASALLVVASNGDEALKVRGGVTTTAYSEPPKKERPLVALEENREPTEKESKHSLRNFSLKYSITFPVKNLEASGEDAGEIEVRVWEPNWKKFPGWNSPYIEVVKEGVRVGMQRFKEVGWLEDVWAASHQREVYLYVQTAHRHRSASGTNIYRYDNEASQFQFSGLFLARESLADEMSR